MFDQFKKLLCTWAKIHGACIKHHSFIHVILKSLILCLPRHEEIEIKHWDFFPIWKKKKKELHWAENTRASICCSANSGVKRCPETAEEPLCPRSSARRFGGRGAATSAVSVAHRAAEVAPHGEVTRVPPPGSHSASGALPQRAAALIEAASATEPPLAGGDKRSHLLKLDQRNPAWIKLSFFFVIFFPPHCCFFSLWREKERERERHCLLWLCK